MRFHSIVDILTVLRVGLAAFIPSVSGDKDFLSLIRTDYEFVLRALRSTVVFPSAMVVVVILIIKHKEVGFMPVADVFRDMGVVKGAFEVIQRHKEHAIVCVDPASSHLGGLVPL